VARGRLIVAIVGSNTDRGMDVSLSLCFCVALFSKGVLTSALIRLRNVWCEVAKVLTRIVEPQLMMTLVTQFKNL
jgi:hypothetical protein